MTDDKFLIEVVNVVEHEDGGATYTFDMSDGVAEIVNELGLKLLLYCGMAQKSPDRVFEALANEILKGEPKDAVQDDA